MLVDQHPLWLDAIEPVVAKIDVAVLARTTSATAGLALVEELQPNILVTGLDMPPGEIDGITLVRRAKEKAPELKPIVISTHHDGAHIDAALEAGAVAYVVKTAQADDIASAIRQAFSHSIYLAGMRPAASLEAAPSTTAGPDLTRREIEILQLVAEGHSNAQLARRLWVTEQTVKFHLSNIYRKLDVSNRTEASRWAQLNGLLSPARTRATVA
ncbi:MAG: response regulator transcription factor [Actinomycetota bacterium]|nr:response regulator transcription factor [Actinomycetota bacterium]